MAKIDSQKKHSSAKITRKIAKSSQKDKTTKKIAQKTAKKVAKKTSTKVARKTAKKIAKKTSAKVARKVAQKTVRAERKTPEAPRTKPTPPPIDLATAAYLIYLERIEKGLPGDALGDWAAAERRAHAA